MIFKMKELNINKQKIKYKTAIKETKEKESQELK